jgi:lipase chaperone LimK
MIVLCDEIHLFFAKEGKVEQDFERLRISSQDDELCDTTVKRFCRYQLELEKNRQDK